jgi:hypothetical protein
MPVAEPHLAPESPIGRGPTLSGLAQVGTSQRHYRCARARGQGQGFCGLPIQRGAAGSQLASRVGYRRDTGLSDVAAHAPQSETAQLVVDGNASRRFEAPSLHSGEMTSSNGTKAVSGSRPVASAKHPVTPPCKASPCSKKTDAYGATCAARSTSAPPILLSSTRRHRRLRRRADRLGLFAQATGEVSLREAHLR